MVMLSTSRFPSSRSTSPSSCQPQLTLPLHLNPAHTPMQPATSLTAPSLCLRIWSKKARSSPNRLLLRSRHQSVVESMGLLGKLGVGVAFSHENVSPDLYYNTLRGIFCIENIEDSVRERKSEENGYLPQGTLY